MKQHITIKQYEELSEMQKHKLFMLLGYTSIIEINIGKMIEILCTSDFHFPSIGLTEARDRAEWIVVHITSLSGTKKYYGKSIEAEELCDALWEAVKLILDDIELPDYNELMLDNCD